MLVNDFGSINIDAELVVGIESDGAVINLANGCVCCNIREDLVASVTQMMARPEKPEYEIRPFGRIGRERMRLSGTQDIMDGEGAHWWSRVPNNAATAASSIDGMDCRARSNMRSQQPCTQRR